MRQGFQRKIVLLKCRVFAPINPKPLHLPLAWYVGLMEITVEMMSELNKNGSDRLIILDQSAFALPVACNTIYSVDIR